MSQVRLTETVLIAGEITSPGVYDSSNWSDATVRFLNDRNLLQPVEVSPMPDPVPEKPATKSDIKTLRRKPRVTLDAPAATE
jgi:hypothetical protein